MKVLCGTALACALMAAVGLATAGASTAKSRPLCGLGQASSKAKPCTANPAFAKTACAKLAPTVAALTGAALTVGANKAAPTNIDCYYKIGGKPQQFSLIVSKFSTGSPDAYATVLKEREDWPANAAAGTMPGCFGNGQESPVNAPQALSGLGDKAFSWDQCSDGFNDSTSEVYAVKGKVFYAAAMRHWTQATPTADQLVPFVQQLITKYH
jgi:hypothetical protein